LSSLPRNSAPRLSSLSKNDPKAADCVTVIATRGGIDSETTEFTMISVTTAEENFRDWDHFTDAYYLDIRDALASLRFVPRDLVDDWTQSFFADKLIAKNFLKQRPELRGPFRNWLFTAVRNHARDELRKMRRRARRESTESSAGADFEDRRPAAAPVFESDALYASTYLAVAFRTAQQHWDSVDRGEKWRIFDALVLGDAAPEVSRPTRERLLSEFPGRDAQFLTNCVTTVKRSIRAILPLLLPAELSDRTTSDERFAEWKEILRDGQITALGWLRWVVPVAWLDSTNATTYIPSIGLAVDGSDGRVPPQTGALLDEDDSGELPAEFKHDHLRFAQSVLLALPLSTYLDESSVGADDNPSPFARGALGEARFSDTLQALLAALADGRPAEDVAALTSRMQELKRFGKQIHHAATRTEGDSTPRAPRELGQLVYTLAAAVALEGAGQRIDSLEPALLAGNIAWALKQPWLDPRLAPILHRAHSNIVEAFKISR
jgi:DNA-directed RNA polymerase specialized sigma24 family protein